MSLKTLNTQEHNEDRWTVEFHRSFKPEFDRFAKAVRVELIAHAFRLEEAGPLLGRPGVDTLKGSRFANMKELRFYADGGVWRLAFAFDPQRKTILLVGGDKTGVSENRFYRNLISVADRRFEQHLIEVFGTSGR